MIWQKLLIATCVLGFSVACNRQVAPCTQTANTQTTPSAGSSLSNVTPASKAQSHGPSDKLKEGRVPEEATAIAIAIAVWNPMYGKAHIETEKPYHATLKDGVWTVTGTVPLGYDGGTAFAEIAQDDGRVLRVIHYQ